MAGDPAWVVDNIRRAMHVETDEALVATLAANARRTLAWLKQQGIRFIKGGPDGLRQNSLAPPGVRQTGLHWQGRAGDVVLRTLADALRRRGGVLTRGVEARQLLMENARCAGILAREDGAEVRLEARAVVLADGGFQADIELMKRFISPAPERLLMRNARSGRGSGLRMAEAVGEKLAGMTASTATSSIARRWKTSASGPIRCWTPSRRRASWWRARERASATRGWAEST
jgi:fumarate reductase flavoprotein subunit